MKLNLISLKTALALTTFTLVGLSSCQNDFDFDEAYAVKAQQQFDNVFIKEFGKPAEGHKWGFDLAWANEDGSSTRAYDPRNEATVNKVEYEYMPTLLHYGMVPNITQREHDEVYEWFSTHQVTWTNTTDGSDVADGQRKQVWFDLNNLVPTKGVEGGKARKIGELSSTNSLRENTDNYWLNEPTVNLEFSYDHLWIQNVANDPNKDDVDNNGNSMAATDAMNYLHISQSDGTAYHLNEFNCASGWGWGNQNEKLYYNDNGQQYDKNGVFVCGQNFNNLAYHNTRDSKFHDKWIIVHLKGADYEGYYLGFDIEGAQDSSNGANYNQEIHANGICNDWIVKLTPKESPAVVKARIMCEDLGGDGERVAANNKVTLSDIDYNDIVLDVDNSQNQDIVRLTLRAAGGTLPLAVFYDDMPLFETHEMFEADMDWNQAKSHRTEINYSIMYNTGSSTATAKPKSYTLYFGTNDAVGNHSRSFSSASFDMEKLAIKVYRFGVQDYVSSNPTPSPAVWAEMKNNEDGAPVKICLPIDTKWSVERVPIHKAYLGFANWVKYPSNKFWEGERVEYNLVGGIAATEPGEGGGTPDTPNNPGEGGGTPDTPDNPGEGDGTPDTPENPGEGGGTPGTPDNPGVGGGTPNTPDNPGEGATGWEKYGTLLSTSNVEDVNGRTLNAVKISQLPNSGKVTITAICNVINQYNLTGDAGIYAAQTIEGNPGYSYLKAVQMKGSVNISSDKKYAVYSVTVNASDYKNLEYIGFFNGWSDVSFKELRYKQE